MACSKSFSSTPTMMLSSSGPCVIMRMFTPFSPSVAKMLTGNAGTVRHLAANGGDNGDVLRYGYLIRAAAAFRSSPRMS